MKIKSVRKNQILLHFRIFPALISLTLLLTFCGCTTLSDREGAYTKNGVYFDTLISITLYCNDDAAADKYLEGCLGLCEKYSSLLDANIKGSDIYNINHSAGSYVKVSAETIDIIEKSLCYSNISSGLFDITINSASKLWDFHEENGTLPDGDELSKALTHIDYQLISTDKAAGTVCLADKNASIDIGGIAKGYIADEIAGYLTNSEITGALINIGGDITCIGHKPQDRLFSIGITDPFGGNTPILGLSLTDKSVATSGTYERAFYIGDEKYHHILDPKTGYPVDTDVLSSTIIADSGMDADCLGTVAILLGSRVALDLINSTENTEGIIICNNGDILYSDGISQYLE